MENKKFSLIFEGSDLILKVDMNQDGDSVIDLKIKLTELLEEAGYLIAKNGK